MELRDFFVEYWYGLLKIVIDVLLEVVVEILLLNPILNNEVVCDYIVRHINDTTS